MAKQPNLCMNCHGTGKVFGSVSKTTPETCPKCKGAGGHKAPLFANPEVQAEYDKATPKRKAWMMRQRNEAPWSVRNVAEMERLLEKDE